MKSVGLQLREARLAKGWTPQAAAKATKIKEQQLLQLEEEDYSAFPAAAYARGFVRIYARAVGLNDAAVIAQLDTVLASPNVAPPPSMQSPLPVIDQKEASRRFTQPRIFRKFTFWMALLLAMTIFLILAIRIHQVLPSAKHRHSESVAAAPLQTNTSPASAPGEETVAKATAVAPIPTAPKEDEPVAKAIPLAVAPPIPDQKLVLQAKEDCWVRVSVIENGQPRQIFADVIKAGTQQGFPGDHFAVKIAIPAAINVLYNGQSLGVLSDARVPAEFSLPK